ncbi:MAG TPA: hypothetical protein VL285_10630 [Bryobacteraceae bacterium]|nr:hypothetical protein [Bryobacteraceae bacterium]
MRIARLVLFARLVAAFTCPALAVDNVLWDSSGNGLLNGTYNFREVMWSNRGDTHRVAIYGSIQFDGNGGYTLTSSVIDSDIGSVQSFSTTGAYRISASGMGYLDDPIRLNAASPTSTVWGLVSQGVFIGSSTDDGLNDLFIAALAPSSPPANSSFNGSYWAAAVNIPNGDVTQARDMFFRLDPNGQGSLGTVNLTGLVGLGGATVTQNVNGAVYSLANGALTLGFGGALGPQTLIAGNALCYLSADGNFFFGGSANGWDMIVGVRAFAGSVPPNTLNGKYYQAGADVTPAKGFKTLSTYYGAFSAVAASGVLIGHQRILPADPAVNHIPYDYTYSAPFTLAPDGTHEDFLQFHYVIGAGGSIRIGFGNASHLGINIALKAPAFSGSGVYLKPDGIANAGSSAPFTVGVSRGGFIALYGSNLSPTTLQDESKPFLLGGVQVLINNRPAPIRYVRSDVVLAIVPFATTGTVASVQVINNGVPSEIRTVRVKNGTPGVYTSPAGGVGYAVAQHVQDNSFATVTPQNPAHPGETILVYLTGLGDVDPPVDDGKPASANPLSLVVTRPVAVVDGEEATVGFAGLTPTLIALYAIHVTIPADIAPGDVYLDISLPDSYTSEAQIPIGSNSLGIQAPAGTRLLRTPPRERPPARIPGTLRRFPDR